MGVSATTEVDEPSPLGETIAFEELVADAGTMVPLDEAGMPEASREGGIVGRFGHEVKLRGSFRPAVESRMLKGASASFTASPSLFESENSQRLRGLAAPLALASASFKGFGNCSAPPPPPPPVAAAVVGTAEVDKFSVACDWFCPGLPGTVMPALAGTS